MDQQEWQNRLRALPSVTELLKQVKMEALLTHYPRTQVLEGVRRVLEAKREVIRAGESPPPLEMEELIKEVDTWLAAEARPSLKRVINASGVIIHTNLGRSILPRAIMEQVLEIGIHYSNLEYDLQEGRRGSRFSHVEKLLCELTGAEAAMVVNNNAGAVYLVLDSLASGREVVVSRGQLVEIGGSFRIPDVMAKSGAILKEVGTTNKTHLYDYERAITPDTALLLKVHASNFRIVGFTQKVSLEEMVVLGNRHRLPVMEDLGSGCLIDLSRYGRPKEPMAQESVALGASIVTFSGDKLLGGPQAGLIVGKRELVEQVRKNPMARALRVDKLTLAALEATLRLYRDEARAIREIPTLKAFLASPRELKIRASRLKVRLKREAPELGIYRVRESVSEMGGGALPWEPVPTFVLAVTPKGDSASGMQEKLRKGPLPVIGRIEQDELLLDVRTILPEEEKLIAGAFKALSRREG
jgi:L-seryl-tRNA(Ser) seleniumtransferase